jgi:hypothetical protein
VRCNTPCPAIPDPGAPWASLQSSRFREFQTTGFLSNRRAVARSRLLASGGRGRSSVHVPRACAGVHLPSWSRGPCVSVLTVCARLLSSLNGNDTMLGTQVKPTLRHTATQVPAVLQAPTAQMLVALVHYTHIRVCFLFMIDYTSTAIRNNMLLG